MKHSRRTTKAPVIQAYCGTPSRGPGWVASVDNVIKAPAAETLEDDGGDAVNNEPLAMTVDDDMHEMKYPVNSQVNVSKKVSK